MLLILLLSTLVSYSQQTWPSTLLWRITGNGLDKPSYLYGTMHLQDRRLFYFGDSLYQSIEYSKGFAMEVDPDEMIDSVLTKLIKNDNSPLLKDILNKKKYQKVSAKLEKKLGIPANQITKKSLIKARRETLYKSRKKDDMNTMVDMYLYNIAKQQGKWVGGIEDVSDQMDLMDEMGSEVDVDEYLEDIEGEKVSEYKEKMIAAYVRQDINLINEMVSDKASDLELIKRNIKMARRMDSLSKIRNSFFAVGAAHLPGDSGVIKLLRARGFKVEPVFAGKNIAPENYKYIKVDLSWYSYTAEDSAYTIEMPAKPTDLNMFGEELKLKVHADLASGLMYMSGFVFNNDGDADKTAKKMRQSFANNGSKTLEEKKIMNLGIEGNEIIFMQQKYYYRLQLFYVNNKTYMIMTGSEKKEQLYAADAERFLKSFVPNIKVEQKPKLWTDYIDQSKGFKISMPGKVTVSRVKSDNFNMLNYAVMDIANNNYFALAIGEPEKNLYITDDSIILNAKVDYYKQNNFKITDLKKFEFSGSPALSLIASGKNQGFELSSKLLVISRGNRHYTLVAVTEKGKEDFPDISRFFRSFSLTPYQESAWSSNTSSTKTFTTWAPSAITPIPADTSNLSGDELQAAIKEAGKQIEYLSYDTVTAVNYNITAKHPSKYYSAENDSAFLNDELRSYYSDTANNYAKNNPGQFDSLIYLKPVKNGAMPGYEALIKNGSKSYFKRVRIVRNGDTAYHIFVMAPYAIVTNENNNRFFESFRFTNETTSTTLFTNKKELMLADLNSTDSAAREDAAETLRSTTFTSEDVSKLQKAFLQNYPDDSLEYSSIATELLYKLESLNDSSCTQFVENNYGLLPGSSKKKMMLLRLLTNQKNEAALLLAKKILLNNPPKTGSVYAVIRNLEDSLQLAKNLFPEAATLFSNRVVGDGLVAIAAMLIDSNLIDKKILVDNSDAIKSIAKRQTKNLKRSFDEYEMYDTDVMNALKILGDKESIALLNNYVTVPQLDTKKAAIFTLLRMNKPVPALEIKKLAADPVYRTEMYDSLKAVNKAMLFPKELLTQVKFAESYLLNASYDEDTEADNVNFKLLGEKTSRENGVVKRYYIFKMILVYEGSKEEYPAICGPFDLDKTKPSIPTGLKTRILYDDQFPLKSLDALFKKFLKEAE